MSLVFFVIPPTIAEQQPTVIKHTHCCQYCQSQNIDEVKMAFWSLGWPHTTTKNFNLLMLRSRQLRIFQCLLRIPTSNSSCVKEQLRCQAHTYVNVL